MGERPLSSLTAGQAGRVDRIEPSPARLRLLEMGLVRGASVEFIRSAPLGDPIEVRVRAYNLSLRRAEAESIIIVLEPSG